MLVKEAPGDPHILIFLMKKNISDGTHYQYSGTHKDHGLWVPGTRKEVILNLYIFVNWVIIGLNNAWMSIKCQDI